MDIELINKIKRLAIIALASDDELVETLVLKGGNAIDLEIFREPKLLSRTSYDLDYSMIDGEFSEDDDEINSRIERTLTQTFLEHNYHLIDYKFQIKPKVISDELASFWGGYKIQFKVIDSDLYHKSNNDIRVLRNNSIVLNPNSSPSFILEFSKYEYVGEKRSIDVDGYNIYVYTPEMIAFEKLRAICQQMEEYKKIVPQFTPRARARDFYDINLIMELHQINPLLPENIILIENIFHAKRVPTNLIKRIKDNKSTHIDDWKNVLITLSANEEVEDFDFYFDYVISKFENIIIP